MSCKSRAESMFQNMFDFSGETARDWGIELRYDSNDGERLGHRQRRRLHRPRRLRRKRRRGRGPSVQGNQPGAWNHLIHLEVRKLFGLTSIIGLCGVAAAWPLPKQCAVLGPRIIGSQSSSSAIKKSPKNYRGGKGML